MNKIKTLKIEYYTNIKNELFRCKNIHELKIILILLNDI